MRKAEVEANKAKGNAQHWRAQLEHEQEEHGRVLDALSQVEARTAEAQATARGNEQGGAAVLVQWSAKCCVCRIDQHVQAAGSQGACAGRGRFRIRWECGGQAIRAGGRES